MGRVTDSKPEGQCAITWTYKESLAINPNIKIHFMNEDGGNLNQLQFGGMTSNDWNSMVVLTDENNYVLTYMTEILGR